MTNEELAKAIVDNDYDVMIDHTVATISDIDTAYGTQSYYVIPLDGGGWAIAEVTSAVAPHHEIAAEYIGVKLSKTKLVKIAREYYKRCRSSLQDRLDYISWQDMCEYKQWSRDSIKDIIAL